MTDLDTLVADRAPSHDDGSAFIGKSAPPPSPPPDAGPRDTAPGPLHQERQARPPVAAGAAALHDRADDARAADGGLHELPRDFLRPGPGGRPRRLLASPDRLRPAPLLPPPQRQRVGGVRGWRQPSPDARAAGLRVTGRQPLSTTLSILYTPCAAATAPEGHYLGLGPLHAGRAHACARCGRWQKALPQRGQGQEKARGRHDEE
eukprot:scaffold5521_cov358-Prasinococcus_capsulatus_cf.AAC.5